MYQNSGTNTCPPSHHLTANSIMIPWKVSPALLRTSPMDPHPLRNDSDAKITAKTTPIKRRTPV